MPTTPPTITPLPTPPDPNDRSTFNARAYPWSVAQQTLATQQGAVATNVYDNAVEAAGSATTATTQAAAAAASAASAINAPGTSATSITSLTLATGTKVLTLAQTGKAFALGQQVKLSRNAAPTTRMFGAITAFNSGTGAMTVEVTLPVEGTGGPYTDWDIALGTAVIMSNAPANIDYIARTSNTMLVAADKGDWFNVTSGTFTQTADTAAALGAGWWAELGNSGTGVVTFGSLAIYQGQRYRLHSDGTTIRTTALADQGVMTVVDEKTSGTNGGAATATTWNARDLNTVQSNSISGASLASNQITLPAGKYQINASAPAFATGGAQRHKLRLYNVTGSAVLLNGTSELCLTNTQSRSVVSGVITLSGTTAIRLDHYTTNGVASAGLGETANIASVSEVFAEIVVRKVG